MGTLRLPDPAGLPPRVLFHREHPSEPVLILQVPDPGAEESETYVIRLDKPEHRTWVGRLKGSRWLLDMLLMEMHVIYSVADGAVQALPNLDEPLPLAQTFEEARQVASSMHARERAQRRPSTPPAMSRFRMWLTGRSPNRRGRVMPTTRRGGF